MSVLCLKYPPVQRHGTKRVRPLFPVCVCAILVFFVFFTFPATARSGEPAPPGEKPAVDRGAADFAPAIKPPPLPAARRCRAAGEPFQVGEASHYADMLAGYRTAFGGRYDPQRLTAAHRTLPEGARILVRNLRNGHSAIVTVNDRGPFAKTRRGPSGLPRVIDLSGHAAHILGFRGGLARVEIFRCEG